MQSATVLIDSFIDVITKAEVLSDTCRAIRAYEGQNLPVPIRKNYFSFSATENSLYFSEDEEGNKTEVNSIKIAMNCFIPLEFSPASVYTLTESVMNILMKSNENIISITTGKTVYDSDVDSFRINCEIHFRTEIKV